jgi:hypothetical protein
MKNYKVKIGIKDKQKFYMVIGILILMIVNLILIFDNLDLKEQLQLKDDKIHEIGLELVQSMEFNDVLSICIDRQNKRLDGLSEAYNKSDNFIFDSEDLRVVSGLTGDEIEKHLRGGLKGYGDSFIFAEETYGINAMLLVGLSRLESSNGKYKYMDRNNIFSWGANTNSPDDAIGFNSIEECIKIVSNRLSTRLDKRNDWSMNSLRILYNAEDREWMTKVIEVIECEM